jgi:hypothetical protein
VETNVRIPQCALDALETVATSRRASRDETVRQLLAEHVAGQEVLDADRRLTHISTVLRYPPAPRHRTERPIGRLLRLRLDPGMAERARAVSLRLPGQAPRAHHDYQARLLTDAVVTAIARVQDFTDEFLTGMKPVLRHRSALGLWHWAVAATSTGPEEKIRTAAARARPTRVRQATTADPDKATAQRRVLLVDEALDASVAWHMPDRFVVAANLARACLTGAAADACEHVLFEQGPAWNATRRYLRALAGELGLHDGVLPGFDWSGRGGAAVWRAQREVELDDFEDWLLDRPDGEVERDLAPPGWGVRTPDAWRAHAVRDEVPEPFAAWVRAGQVLAFPGCERTVLWPLSRTAAAPGWGRVAGIEPLADAARRLQPRHVRLFVEAMLIDWQTSAEVTGVGGIEVPIDKAEQFGLVDAEYRRQAKSEVRASNLARMRQVIDDLSPDQHELRAALSEVMGNAPRFAAVAARAKIAFFPVRARWLWPVGTVANQVASGLSLETLHWLVAAVRRSHALVLRTQMQAAWEAAYHRYWRPNPTAQG